MLGRVFKANISIADKQHPHWYVVIHQFKSNKNCTVIPAYSEGGAAVTDTINALKKAGYPAGAIAVLLDNSLEVDLEPGVMGHKAWWLTAKKVLLTEADLAPFTVIGQMKPSGLKMLAQALLSLDSYLVGKHRPALLSTDIKDGLKKL